MEQMQFSSHFTNFAWKQELNVNDIVEGKYPTFLVKSLKNGENQYFLITGDVVVIKQNDEIFITAIVIKTCAKEFYDLNSSLGVWSKTPNGHELVLRCS